MASATELPTVFVIDDDPAARESLAAVVESMRIPARTFASAEDFLEAYDPRLAGCAVCDVRMTGISGIDLLARLGGAQAALPVILITAYADVPLAVRVMRQGAFSLLEKPCRNHDLWDEIRRALEADAENRRRRALQGEIARRFDSLTPEERRVMQLVAQGKMNKEMAGELDVSLRTVETRRKSMFEKLGVDSPAELVNLLFASKGIQGN
ncbi:MAG: response regulator [Pirellulales bacterium]|nr:response regulator [Pirellulales bacterium]